MPWWTRPGQPPGRIPRSLPLPRRGRSSHRRARCRHGRRRVRSRSSRGRQPARPLRVQVQRLQSLPTAAFAGLTWSQRSPFLRFLRTGDGISPNPRRRRRSAPGRARIRGSSAPRRQSRGRAPRSRRGRSRRRCRRSRPCGPSRVSKCASVASRCGAPGRRSRSHGRSQRRPRWRLRPGASESSRLRADTSTGSRAERR